MQFAMELLCYLYPGWEPRIRPADPRRDWMDHTPESFAYRCLPLAIANSHGWEIVSPMGFEATWNGGPGTDAVSIRLPSGARTDLAPVSIFGHGVLTFHIYGLFRTPAGWNLWAGGPPNAAKDGIAPLTGVIETDWSPYTFTMNWRFTRPHQWVRFEEEEPICFIFPVQRGVLENIVPILVPMESNLKVMREFKTWSASRDAFRERVERESPRAPTDRWQKRYFLGLDMSDREKKVADHQTKLRVRPFTYAEKAVPPVVDQRAVAANSDPSLQPAAANADAATLAAHDAPDFALVSRAIEIIAADLIAVSADVGALARRLGDRGVSEADARAIAEAATKHPLMQKAHAASLRLRKRDWLLDVMEKLQGLKPGADRIERCAGLTRDEFLETYYAANRPVILSGEMAGWPALANWTPSYLSRVVGSTVIEYQGERNRSERFEMHKDEHWREMSFDQFIDLITQPDAGNDAYMTAYNSVRNTDALAPLHADLGFPEKFLSPRIEPRNGMMWIGPAGTVTSLHHDLTNNLIAQVVGRKRIKIIAAAHVAKVYNHHHVFSEISDLEVPGIDASRYPALRDARIYDVTLAPGEMIFMPIGWWHQVKSLDFSVTITYTNFHWRNDWHQSYPSG